MIDHFNTVTFCTTLFLCIVAILLSRYLKTMAGETPSQWVAERRSMVEIIRHQSEMMARFRGEILNSGEVERRNRIQQNANQIAEVNLAEFAEQPLSQEHLQPISTIGRAVRGQSTAFEETRSEYQSPRPSRRIVNTGDIPSGSGDPSFAEIARQAERH